MRFNNLTKKISVALVSSSLILNGCKSHDPEKKEEENQVVHSGGGGAVYPHWWYFYHGGYHSGGGTYHPSGGGVHISGARGGGFKSSPSVSSSRGGFGASGHHFSGGS